MRAASQPSGPSICAVRPAQSEDYARMAELACQLGYPSTENQVRVRLDGMQGSEQYAVFVAELTEGQVAGWIGVYVFRTVEMDNSAMISGLIVDQNFRSLGIGKVLLDAAEEWARSHSYGGICVSSNVKRYRAHNFYKANAYTQIKTQHVFQKRLSM